MKRPNVNVSINVNVEPSAIKNQASHCAQEDTEETPESSYENQQLYLDDSSNSISDRR